MGTLPPYSSHCGCVCVCAALFSWRKDDLTLNTFFFPVVCQRDDISGEKTERGREDVIAWVFMWASKSDKVRWLSKVFGSFRLEGSNSSPLFCHLPVLESLLFWLFPVSPSFVLEYLIWSKIIAEDLKDKVKTFGTVSKGPFMPKNMYCNDNCSYKVLLIILILENWKWE